MPRRRFNDTERLLASFAALIALGTGLLCLPQCTVGEEPLDFVDALFTATSAVCVTGLAVQDTGSYFTFLGQAIILILIQLGGLGILTLSNWLLLSLTGRRSDPDVRHLLMQTHGRAGSGTPAGLLMQIFAFTFTCETLGAALLYSRFVAVEGLENPLWQAVFHSVSAFCNAGFGLFSDSLMSYRSDPVINFTVMFLIVAGGLGFVVCAELFNRALRPKKNKKKTLLSYHSHVVLTTTAALIVAGAVGVFVLEGRNTLAGKPIPQQIMDSLFLSITSRTAGFNTIDTGALGNATLCMVMLLMGIGASPGSTGGGVKTTSFAMLIGFLWSKWKGREKTEWLGRSVPSDLVAKAVAAAAAFAVLTLGSVILIEFVEVPAGAPQLSRGLFLQHLFEIVSALGTVGLSTGITSSLDVPTRLLLVVLMFIGRLGPLVIANSVIGQRKRVRYTLPEDDLMVG
jgi:trk system potassium uptake protein TrkH